MKTAGRSIIALLTVALTLAACESAPPKPMETVEDTIEVSATVEKIDVLNRLLTLKTESGEVVTVEVDPVVQNLVQVRPGDRVVARYPPGDRRHDQQGGRRSAGHGGRRSGQG